MVLQPSRRFFVTNCELIAGNLPAVAPRTVPHAAVKRTIDIVLSLVLLAIFIVPMVIIFLLVKLTSKGPALYASERIGYCAKPFRFLKFRTMHVDAEARLADLLRKNEKDGPIFKMAKDPRITWVGRLLRKSSLDELPQLIHVLTGEMTLVGPRPPIRREVMLYNEDALQRLSVKPGITCYWQIGGRSNLSFERWIELDHKYLNEMSLKTDMQILLKTPLAVLTGKGAY